MMHISEGEGTRGCKEVKEREKDQGLRRGSRVNALFELCKIAAWERGGMCVCLSVTEEAERRRKQGKSTDTSMINVKRCEMG